MHSSHAFILTTLLSRNNNLKMPSQNILAEFKNNLSYFFFQPDKLLTVSPKCSKMNFWSVERILYWSDVVFWVVTATIHLSFCRFLLLLLFLRKAFVCTFVSRSHCLSIVQTIEFYEIDWCVWDRENFFSQSQNGPAFWFPWAVILTAITTLWWLQNSIYKDDDTSLGLHHSRGLSLNSTMEIYLWST